MILSFPILSIDIDVSTKFSIEEHIRETYSTIISVLIVFVIFIVNKVINFDIFVFLLTYFYPNDFLRDLALKLPVSNLF